MTEWIVIFIYISRIVHFFIFIFQFSKNSSIIIAILILINRLWMMTKEIYNIWILLLLFYIIFFIWIPIIIILTFWIIFFLKYLFYIFFPNIQIVNFFCFKFSIFKYIKYVWVKKEFEILITYGKLKSIFFSSGFFIGGGAPDLTTKLLGFCSFTELTTKSSSIISYWTGTSML